MLLTTLLTLSSPGALAADAPPPAPVLAPSIADAPEVRQGRVLRNVGVTAAFVGPPIVLGGVVLAVQAILGPRSYLRGGLVTMTAGGLITVSSVPLLLASSARTRVALRRYGLAGPRSALPYLAVGGLAAAVATPVVALGIMNLRETYTAELEVTALAVGFLALGVGSGWIWANQNLAAAKVSDVRVGILHLPAGAGQTEPTWGLEVSGRF